MKSRKTSFISFVAVSFISFFLPCCAMKQDVFDTFTHESEKIELKYFNITSHKLALWDNEKDICSLDYTIIDGSSTATIQGVYTMPKYRKKGYASFLVEKAISINKNNGVLKVELEVFPGKQGFLSHEKEKQEQENIRYNLEVQKLKKWYSTFNFIETKGNNMALEFK